MIVLYWKHLILLRIIDHNNRRANVTGIILVSTLISPGYKYDKRDCCYLPRYLPIDENLEEVMYEG